MEPIISPWLIYVVSLVNSLIVISCLLCLLSLVGIFLGSMAYDPDASEEDRKISNRILKYSVLGVIVFGGLSIFIPSKETILAMLAASYATPDNIHAVQGNIVDFVSQIVNAVNQAGGK